MRKVMLGLALPLVLGLDGPVRIEAMGAKPEPATMAKGEKLSGRPQTMPVVMLLVVVTSTHSLPL